MGKSAQLVNMFKLENTHDSYLKQEKIYFQKAMKEATMTKKSIIKQ